MPLTPSTLNGTVKAYNMMELANLDMENGVLQGVDSLLQLGAQQLEHPSPRGYQSCRSGCEVNHQVQRAGGEEGRQDQVAAVMQAAQTWAG